MAIQYTNRLNNDINRIVRNFNQKIKRLEKSERDLILPEKVSIRDLKKNVNTKWDLNRELKKLQRFTERGSEEVITTKGGVTLPKYELQNIEAERRRIYAKLSRTIEKTGNIRPSIAGVRVEATFSQMGSEQIANLKARRRAIGTGSIKNLSSEKLKNVRTLINKTVAKEQYLTEVFMNNYIDKMLSPVAYSINYDQEKLEIIRRKMLTLKEKDFLKMFEGDELIRRIKDLYIDTKNPTLLRRNMEEATEIFDSLYDNIDVIIDLYSK